MRVLFLCDTFQTFPSFIYLIPVIMLFGVNEGAAISAVVLYAAVPLIRYTIEGRRGVPVGLIEAADMSGASRNQTLWNVRLPMALPTIMVGLNPSVMFSLFMVIFAAFIGTQDLGQELQRAVFDRHRQAPVAWPQRGHHRPDDRSLDHRLGHAAARALGSVSYAVPRLACAHPGAAR